MADRPPEQEPAPTPAESLFKVAQELMATYPEHCFTDRSKSTSVLVAQSSEGKEYVLVGRHGHEAHPKPPRDLCIHPVIKGAISDGICVVNSERNALVHVDITGVPYADNLQEGSLEYEVVQDMAQRDANQLETAAPAPLTPEKVRLIISQIDSDPRTTLS